MSHSWQFRPAIITRTSYKEERTRYTTFYLRKKKYSIFANKKGTFFVACGESLERKSTQFSKTPKDFKKGGGLQKVGAFFAHFCTIDFFAKGGQVGERGEEKIRKRPKLIGLIPIL